MITASLAATADSGRFHFGLTVKYKVETASNSWGNECSTQPRWGWRDLSPGFKNPGLKYAPPLGVLRASRASRGATEQPRIGKPVPNVASSLGEMFQSLSVQSPSDFLPSTFSRGKRARPTSSPSAASTLRHFADSSPTPCGAPREGSTGLRSG